MFDGLSPNSMTSPETPEENIIDVDCPNCGMVPHKELVDQYECLTCGCRQDKDSALTREETSW